MTDAQACHSPSEEGSGELAAQVRQEVPGAPERLSGVAEERRHVGGTGDGVEDAEEQGYAGVGVEDGGEVELCS